MKLIQCEQILNELYLVTTVVDHTQVFLEQDFYYIEVPPSQFALMESIKTKIATGKKIFLKSLHQSEFLPENVVEDVKFSLHVKDENESTYRIVGLIAGDIQSGAQVLELDFETQRDVIKLFSTENFANSIYTIEKIAVVELKNIAILKEKYYLGFRTKMNLFLGDKNLVVISNAIKAFTTPADTSLVTYFEIGKRQDFLIFNEMINKYGFIVFENKAAIIPENAKVYKMYFDTLQVNDNLLAISGVTFEQSILTAHLHKTFIKTLDAMETILENISKSVMAYAVKEIDFADGNFVKNTDLHSVSVDDEYLLRFVQAFNAITSQEKINTAFLLQYADFFGLVKEKNDYIKATLTFKNANGTFDTTGLTTAADVLQEIVFKKIKEMNASK